MSEDSAYFSGEKLIGDDYTVEEIEQWYADEKEGYADISDTDMHEGQYIYHSINNIHGFKYLPKKVYENVLGFGSAYGHEFEPILDKIGNLTIVEPSDTLVSNKVGTITPTYVKPSIEGKLDLPDSSFDLVTSLGVLHHVANVSFVMKELFRILKPGGYFLLREPIVSMGDWRQPRKGLTMHERGIPLNYFKKIIQEDDSIIIEKESYFFCMTNFMERTIGKALKKPVKSYPLYIKLDSILGKALKWNIHYHHDAFHKKVGPQNVYFILKKAES